MNSLYKNDQSDSFDNRDLSKQIIEHINFKRGIKELDITSNDEIVFLLEGKIHMALHSYPEYIATTDDILFLPAGQVFSYSVLSDSSFVVFRISNLRSYCQVFFEEEIEESLDINSTSLEKSFNLKMNSFVRDFLNNLIVCINHGLNSRDYLELKINELFFILQANYSKEEILQLLTFILNSKSNDTQK